MKYEEMHKSSHSFLYKLLKRFNKAELMLTNSKEFSNIRAIKNREIQNII